jgi:hypothetical protein
MQSAIDLTTLLAVKRRAEVGLTQPGGVINPVPDDVEIQAAITGFSQHLLNCSGQGSLNSVVTLDEFYNGNGNNRLMLRSWPVLSLIAVNMSGVAFPLSNSTQNWGAYVGQGGRNIAIRGGVGNFSTFPYPYIYSPGKGPVFLKPDNHFAARCLGFRFGSALLPFAYSPCESDERASPWPVCSFERALCFCCCRQWRASGCFLHHEFSATGS